MLKTTNKKRKCIKIVEYDVYDSCKDCQYCINTNIGWSDEQLSKEGMMRGKFYCDNNDDGLPVLIENPDEFLDECPLEDYP